MSKYAYIADGGETVVVWTGGFDVVGRVGDVIIVRIRIRGIIAACWQSGEVTTAPST